MSWTCRALSLVLLGALSGCWFTGKNGGADAGSGVTTTTGGGSGGTGGTTGTSATTGSTGNAQAACQQQAQALCGMLSQCQELSTTIDCPHYFTSDCVAQASGTQVPDPSALSACQTATRGAECNLLGIFAAISACSPSSLFKASVGPGGACTQSSDCLPQPDGGSMTCLAPKGTCAGTCRAGLSAGEPCGSNDWNHYVSCLSGYCSFGQSLPDGGQSPEVCQAYATLGQNCTSGQSCDPATSFCNSPPGQQLCQARAGSGAACDYSEQCQSSLFCFNPDGGYSDRTCTPKLGAGGDCTTFYDACDPAHTTCDSTGHCAALATQGQSCANGETCEPTTFCDYNNNYVCSPKHPAGQACSYDDCQAGTYCHSPDGGFGNSVCTTQVGAGSSCQDNTEACGQGTFCDYSNSYVCAPVTAQGQDCSTVSTCDPASYCTYVAGTSTCAALLGPGQPCDFGSSCQANYYCHSPDGGFSNGSCTATLSAGQPCNSSDYGSCGRQASCTNGLCNPYEANPGEPCIVGSTYCNSNGQGSQYCAGVDGGVGVCTPRPTVDAGSTQFPNLGDACQSFVDGGDSCYFVYRCVSGTCRALPDVGESCSGSQCRLGLYCSAGTCTAASRLGGSCDPSNSDSCLEGHCGSNRTCVDYKQAGQSCDPHAQDCSSSESCSYFNDGGMDCTDRYCVAQGNGAPVCVTSCD